MAGRHNFLTDESDEDDQHDKPDRIGVIVFCCVRFCLPCILCIVLSIGALGFAVNRNYMCTSEALAAVEPPYDGELLPPTVVLKERVYTWGLQFTKLVDVYDQNHTHLGYFYDMNFLFFMRFGYSDASDRIWFEARRPWWKGAGDLSTWWYRQYVYHSEHLYLARCDHGLPRSTNGRLDAIYSIDEDTTIRPWWCQHQCMKILDVSRNTDDGAAPTPLARVHFNYTLEWYYGGFKTRAAWNMVIADPQTKAKIATAHQYFGVQNKAFAWQGQRFVSRWHVDTLIEEPLLPNWVIVFMAVLDDIDEGGGGSGDKHR